MTYLQVVRTSTDSDQLTADEAAGRALNARLLGEANQFMTEFCAQRRATGDEGDVPSAEEVTGRPDFWLYGPGRALVELAFCHHDIPRTSSCPLCPAEVHLSA